MSTSADTFADLVDQLAEALDGARITEATGEEGAARVHFSRYHFDRISSVAGEPPRAFRRWILLEPAAYRMITTSAPLLDIAVEAGYGSHEAFTPRLHEGVRRPAGRVAAQARVARSEWSSPGSPAPALPG